jgi:hypothetical protein
MLRRAGNLRLVGKSSSAGRGVCGRRSRYSAVNLCYLKNK